MMRIRRSVLVGLLLATPGDSPAQIVGVRCCFPVTSYWNITRCMGHEASFNLGNVAGYCETQFAGVDDPAVQALMDEVCIDARNKQPLGAVCAEWSNGVPVEARCRSSQGWIAMCCEFDFDDSGWIDLRDYAALQVWLPKEFGR